LGEVCEVKQGEYIKKQTKMKEYTQYMEVEMHHLVLINTTEKMK
jgi:hypothetical protein